MATKPKRTTKSSKTAPKPSVSKAIKKPSRPTAVKAARPVTKAKATKPKVRASKSKSSQQQEFWRRTPFLFYTVLIAAFLIAITLGFMTYKEHKTNKFPVSASDTQGVLFLQSLESDGKYVAGDTLDVTLYEDSGKQAVNALQAAVKYPSEKLELVEIQEGTAFPQVAATDTATAGLVRVARSIKPGESSVKGAKPVVIVKFKVLTDSNDPFEFTVDDSTSLLVRSSDNENILGSNANNKFEL